ncbi:XdhC family protein [Nonomuraea glycinis]|uniref:XdhC Rossmann domain-containing protein n=1 Tax=Nonomuraea glycinis TaxID=2047744 RepID=A0A918E6W9_9ACTN|nr:XdhC family protein [Nonomuraea glycinis]MCA2179121.1 XdhC family protein [Nonomuraea glycinis]GGP08722.1 hypothetical protein GCM10012278_41580 [Nonomuraea glycinis]
MRAQSLRLLQRRRPGQATLLRITPEADEPREEEGLVASHGVSEEPVLLAALAAGVPYIGLIAARERGAPVLAAVAGGDRVHVPAGLDIGAVTPGEVAVSIYAQIIELGVRGTL